jgi:2-methylcitrate dehydratase PrpD
MAGAEGIYTRRMAEYVANARNEPLPDDLTEWMKLLTLDTIGCGLLASPLPWTQRLLDTLVAVEQPGPSLVWGTDKRLSPANAAMVNGTAVHGFELDDVGAGGHNGSVSTTVALALAEAGAPLTGMDLLRAQVTCVEIAARVSDCVGRIAHVTNGFHGPGLYGAFGAMAAASQVLGLNTQQVVYAIGNVAQFTGGLMGTHHGGMGKRLLAGKAAHNGTLAAQLAAHGFTNVDNIMECGYGSFPSAFSGARDNFDLEALTRGLGKEFKAYGVNFKMWAARVPIHPSMEAVKALRKQHEIRPEQIERVDIGLTDGSYKAVGFEYHPTTITSAQLNLQYCMAIMLIENDLFIDQFTEEKIKRPDVLDMVSKIHIRHDPSLDEATQGGIARETIVDITLKNGQKLTRRGTVRGHEGNNPVTRTDVLDKFRKTANNRLTTEEQDRMIDLCDHLHELPDARVLLEPLGKGAATVAAG